MKYFIFVLILFSSTLYAQSSEPKEESREELLKKLHKIMDEASKSMEESEKDLARASLPPTKPDIIAERVKSIIQKMKDNKISKEELPDSVKEYLKNHPELKDKSVKEIAESEKLLEELFEIESKAELKLEESNSAAASAENVSNAVDIANKLRQGGQNNDDKMKDNKSSTNDPKNKLEKAGNSTKPSNEQVESKPDNGKDDLSESQIGRQSDGSAFKADSKAKNTEAGNSSDNNTEPVKYKGLWRLWCDKIRSRR